MEGGGEGEGGGGALPAHARAQRVRERHVSQHRDDTRAEEAEGEGGDSDRIGLAPLAGGEGGVFGGDALEGAGRFDGPRAVEDAPSLVEGALQHHKGARVESERD